jgi:Stigma-specific protein, Stig1
MRLRDWLVRLRPALAVIVPLAIGLAGCGTDPLVGGGCREGLSECSLKCVDLNQDPNNCGACGKVCSSELICFGGECRDEGSVFPFGRDGGDAAPDGATGSDVSTGDRSTGDGQRGDSVAGDGVGGDGQGGDGNVCVPPFDTASQCGDCDTQCSGATPVCGLQGIYKCLAACEAPLEACGQVCVDKFSDENNCGTCGMICPSGICQAGKCVGKGFGHEIVIGMDYSDPLISQMSAQVQMLANAVLIVNKPTINVLAYDEFSDAANVVRIQTWLTAIGSGRTINFVSSKDWMSIPSKLAVTDYQVFLVYDQPLAPVDQMATSGTLWNGAIDAFAKGGGVVVVLEGGTGHNADLLTNGGLLPVTSETNIAGTQVNVDAPTDVVGLYLPNVFVARRNSVAFTTTQVADSRHVFVVKDNAGVLPVVVHAVP